MNPQKNPRLSSRKGVALVLAMMIVLIGGVIIALVFDMVFRSAWISLEQRGGYIDHTTMLDTVQTVKGKILAANESAKKTMHVPALKYDSGVAPEDGKLTLDDLRFTALTESKNVTFGSGTQRLEVEVYDMFFKPEWVNFGAFSDPKKMMDFPPVYSIAGVESDKFGPQGEHGGEGTNDGRTSDEPDPDSYGSYLIRVRLFDSKGKLLRTAEEAFVQVLPASSS